MEQREEKRRRKTLLEIQERHEDDPTVQKSFKSQNTAVDFFVTAVLLCSTITSTAGFEVVAPRGSVVGVKGEDLVLPCSLQPPISAVDMEVIWKMDEGGIVHHYKHHQDITDQQHQDYRGRTTLDKDGLARGDLSLKITSARQSDAETYTCKIITKTETKEARVSVRVKNFRVVTPNRPVFDVVGKDLVVPCSLKPSTNAVDDEVLWLIGTQIVHQYKNRQDWPDQQLSAYRGRTTLDRDGLKRGDLSLKITSATLSDTHTYRCYIAPQTGSPVEASVSVTVETEGSSPLITAESVGDGSVSLKCESSGWSIVPEMKWLDSRGQNLSVNPTCVQRLPEGLKVIQEVTVKETDGNKFLCRVTSPGQTREKEVEVQAPLFGHSRYRDWIMLSLVLAILALLMWNVNSSREYEKRISDQEREIKKLKVDLEKCDPKKENGTATSKGTAQSSIQMEHENPLDHPPVISILS